MTSSRAVGSGEYHYLDAAGQERARLAALRRYRLVDQPVEEAYARIAFVAGAIFDCPMATVSLVDEDRVWLAACYGFPPGVRELRKHPGLCTTVIQQDEVYVINDAAMDPRTLANPLIREEMGVRFYAAAPIRSHDGYRLGTVSAIDSRPREVTPRQLTALEHLASMVSDELELRLMVIRSAAAEQRMREAVS